MLRNIHVFELIFFGALSVTLAVLFISRLWVQRKIKKLDAKKKALDDEAAVLEAKLAVARQDLAQAEAEVTQLKMARAARERSEQSTPIVGGSRKQGPN